MLDNMTARDATKPGGKAPAACPPHAASPCLPHPRLAGSLHTPHTHPHARLAAGLDVSMLARAVELIGGRIVETEGSGNVTLDTVRCEVTSCRRTPTAPQRGAVCGVQGTWLALRLPHPPPPRSMHLPAACAASPARRAPPCPRPPPMRVQGDCGDWGAVHLLRCAHPQRQGPRHLTQHRDPVARSSGSHTIAGMSGTSSEQRRRECKRQQQH